VGSVSHGAASSGTFNFNGGILKAGTTGLITSTAGVFMVDMDNVNVKIGGAKIDSNGSDITVAASLAHDVSLGATADGGLTKIGAGVLTLTGTNTYTGNTTIQGGTLSVGSIYLNDSSTVSIASTAVFNLAFSGSDTIGGLVLNGIAQADGTWGATGSGAANINDTFFTGGGMLNVVSAIPEPGTWALSAGAAALAGAVGRRRRKPAAL